MFSCCYHRNIKENLFIEPIDFHPDLPPVKINPISPGLSLSLPSQKKKISISYCNASSQQTLTTLASSDSYNQEPMTMVLPNLYLGSYEDAVNEHQLKEKKNNAYLIAHRKKIVSTFCTDSSYPHA